MTSTNSTEVPAAEAATNQTRREALKKFGRYAAVAPTAMVLLQPSEGHAGWRRRGRGRGWGLLRRLGGGGRWGKGGRGGRSDY